MDTNNPRKGKTSKKLSNLITAYSNNSTLVKNEIFGIGITNASSNEVLKYLVKIITNSSKNLYIVTPNPEIVMFANTHDEFKATLNKADLALCDGVGLFNAAALLGKPLKERIIGTDFMEMVCKEVANWPITVGFLGGGEGVAEKIAECLLAQSPNLKIAFVGQGWSEDGFALAQKYQGNSANKDKNSTSPHDKNAIPNRDVVDILFVAFGAPKQEQWMAEHINKVPVRVMMGVGGAFDQIVDPSLRPSHLVHLLGIGWLYRLVRQPWRIKRQLILIPFMWFVLQKKFAFLLGRV